jgi:recombination protein RecR
MQGINSSGMLKLMQYPAPIHTLIQMLRGLPGVGSKSAARFAFDLLGWPQEQLEGLAQALATFRLQLQPCGRCGCLIEQESCHLCDPAQRDPKQLCVVAQARDIYILEQTRSFRGMYHVLGGLLSPLDGAWSHQLRLEPLSQRLDLHPVEEVIVALDSTLEGDATALLLKRTLEGRSIRLTRLAFGIPLGSALDYVDGTTLARALSGRNSF